MSTGLRDAAVPTRHSVKPPEPGTTDSTRELGLDLAALAARHLFQTDHLHFGYWSEDLTPSLANLRRAQEDYSDFLFSHIPAGVRTILDVGSGTGAFACRLIRAGYEVDCVSPSASQTERLRALRRDTFGDQEEEDDGCVFTCRYQDLRTERRYDVVLFSESFQYIPLDRALAVTCRLLKPGGYLLICDFFRRETPDKGPFGGGHKFAAFEKEVAGLPLLWVADEDITPRMTPNLDLTADFVEEVILPAKQRIFGYLEARYRWPFRALQWLFKRPLQRADEKYMTGQRRGANFAAYKTYRLLLLQKQAEVPHGEPEVRGISPSKTGT